MPITEESPLAPINPYGFSKYVMERMLDDFERAFGIRSAVLRYFNAAGADANGELSERHNPETHLIPRVLMAAAGQIPVVEIFGNDYPTPDGTCIRDYIHVTDIAEAHVRALDHLLSGKNSLKVNLGTGNGYSVQEIIEMTKIILGFPVPTIMCNRREGDPSSLIADVSLAKDILQWIPKHSNLENIIRTAALAFHNYL